MYRTHGKIAYFLAATLFISGCGAVNTPSPLPLPPVAATPPIPGPVLDAPKAGITLLAMPVKPVGNVQPVYLSIANGTGHPISETQALIYMQRTDGNRVAALPLSEAVAQAGGAAGLTSSFETAASYGVPVGVVSAAVGAAAGAALTSGSWTGTRNGMLIGGAAGATLGATVGMVEAHTAAEQRANEQILAFSLHATDPDHCTQSDQTGCILPNATSSGYVFYPRGDYDRVIAVFGDPQAETTITVAHNLSK
jgi:hypothetical protein